MVCITVDDYCIVLYCVGKFAPPPVVLGDNEKNNVVSKVLDPCMRRSTEFPDWVKRHKQELEGKKVLMYCTAGVRCERASSFLRNQVRYYSVLYCSTECCRCCI